MPSSGSTADGYRIVDLRLGQRDVRQRPARRPDSPALRRPGPARPDGHALSRGERRPQPRLDGPRRPAGQEQPRRPLGHPEEHPLGRGLARPQGPRRRGRLAARTADEPVGHVPRHPGHQRHPRYRRAVAPDPRAGLRIDRRRPRRDPAQGRIRSARPQGGAVARRGRARRADDDLADDRRLRPRAGRGRHHHRRPHRQAVQPRPVDRRLPDPRGHLRADPGAAHHPGRPLRRHPGRRRGPVLRPPARPARAAGSARSSSC